MAWYARRATLASIYAAAGTFILNHIFTHIFNHLFSEFHQLNSPRTAYDFLDSLVSKSETVGAALHDTAEFTQYIGQSWRGIIKSWGLL